MKKKRSDKAIVQKLIEAAKHARKNAYAPYSKFQVGAALETSSGKIFEGCNVENASYGVTVCAERAAIIKAVSEGHTKFRRIAIVADSKGPCPPCGICRQALHEFAPDIEIIMTNTKGKVMTSSLSKLLPHAFSNRHK